MLGTDHIAVLCVSTPCRSVVDMTIRRNVLPPSSRLTKLWLGNHYDLIHIGMSRRMNCKLQAKNHAWKSFTGKENVWHVRMGRDILSLLRCTCMIYFTMAQQPPVGQGLPITLRHTTLGRTPLHEWSARRRDLCLTRHNTHNRYSHVPGWTRTHNPSKRAAPDPRLRPRGHWNRRLTLDWQNSSLQWTILWRCVRIWYITQSALAACR